jgi:hypothetical protein
MRRAELTILEDSPGRFRPTKVWISPSLSGQRLQIRRDLELIQPALIETKLSGGDRTLHIDTYEAVTSQDRLHCISADALREMSRMGLKHFVISPDERQCALLCFYDFRFGAGRLSEPDLHSIVHLIFLLGGEFVTDTSQMSHFLTNSPIVPPNLTARVASPNWITECASDGTLHNITPFLIQPFQGLTITSSDLEPDLARALRKTVCANGGAWHDSYDDSIMFLVSSKLSMTPKIRLALTEGVPIVRPDWIFEQAQRLTPPDKFVLNFWCWKDKRSKLFADVSFGLHIECEDRAIVKEAVLANSGKFVKPPDLLIVPHFYHGKNDGQYVTTSWIWHTISEQRMIPRDSSSIYSPFAFEAPSPQLRGLVVTLHRLPDSLRCEFSEGLRCVGVTVHFKISDYTKVIVTEVKRSEISSSAKRLDCPIVKPGWVTELLAKGSPPDVKGFEQDNAFEDDIAQLCAGLIRSSSPRHDDQQKQRPMSSQTLAHFSGDEDEIETKTSPQVRVGYQDSPQIKQKKLGRVPVSDPLLEILGIDF